MQAEYAAQAAESRAVEQERQAAREARLTQEDAEDFRKRQKVSFLASGVTLEGSPLLIMEETRTRGAENVNEILRAGSAGASAVRQEGRMQAQSIRSSGRQAFTSGLTTGLKTAGSAFL